jgi:hypothetical protein
MQTGSLECKQCAPGEAFHSHLEKRGKEVLNTQTQNGNSIFFSSLSLSSPPPSNPVVTEIAIVLVLAGAKTLRKGRFL